MEIAIKVTSRVRTTFPRQNRIDMICHIIEDSNLYVFLGKSRIDGFPIYKRKNTYLDRLGKIQKLRNITPNIYDKYMEVFNIIKDDTDIIREEKVLKSNF